MGHDGALLPDAAGAVPDEERRPSRRDGAAGEEAVGARDLRDDVARDRRVGRDDHDRDLVAAAVLAGRLAADRGGGDVHAALAEHGADAAHHARAGRSSGTARGGRPRRAGG